MRLRIGVGIEAPPRAVWAAIADIATHVDWMAEARTIRFLGHQRSGVGTQFECDTRVGPLRTTDRMEVTEWKPGRAMGIRHVGIVSGVGRFVLRARMRPGRTWFTWDERLTFPITLGGPVGALVARPILRRIWRNNLSRLKAKVESGALG